MTRGISRRDFLRTSLASAVGLGLYGSGLNSWARYIEYVPALVIGSGFGGAVASLRLAEAGIHTVVLERGLRWPITKRGDTFATFDNPDGRAAWLSDTTVEFQPGTDLTDKDPPGPYTGVLERIEGIGMDALVGAGWGGGSIVYNAYLLQPRRELFERVFPKWIDYDEMDDIYYPRVREIINPSTIPADILHTKFYKSTRVNEAQARDAGFSIRPADLGIDWDIVRKEIGGARVPSAIDGQSWYGLNSGAKKSLDQNYLKMAEESGYVEGLTLHVVVDITEIPQDALYLVSVNEINKQGEIVGERHFVCKYLFLAAGSMGTSELLVRAQAKGTLPRLNSEVGRNWAGNGDFILLRGGLANNNARTGGPGGHILIEDRNNPFDEVGVDELVVPKGAFLDVPGPSLYVGMGIAPPIGQFEYDARSDRVILNWPADDPRLSAFVKSGEDFSATFSEANSNSFTAFFSLDAIPQITAHPLGGAGLGKVCDQFGRVKGYRGLYVMDGAMIPAGSAAGVNPALTIAALAERNMERIIEQDIYGKT